MQRQRIFRRGGSTAVLFWLAFAVHAGDAANTPKPAAGDAPSMNGRATDTPAARLTIPPYRSALDGFRPYRADEPLRDWREVNDEVGRLGGHMGHLEGRPQGRLHGSDEREAAR